MPNEELPSTLCAFIALRNKSDAPILFSPQDLIVQAVDDAGEHTLKVYSPEQYKSMMKPTKTWWTILGLLAARDAPAVPGIIGNRMQAADVKAQQQASLLLQRHTVVPQSSYMGVVGFVKHRAKQYQLYVPFGPKSFRFAFTLD